MSRAHSKYVDQPLKQHKTQNGYAMLDSNWTLIVLSRRNTSLLVVSLDYVVRYLYLLLTLRCTGLYKMLKNLFKPTTVDSPLDCMYLIIFKVLLNVYQVKEWSYLKYKC